MTLTSLERDFLERLSNEAWTSPPLFDHSVLDRVVEAGYATRQAAGLNVLHYEITDAGRAAIA